MSREPIETNEYYHIYNHAIEGRDLFPTLADLERFHLSMIVFNSQKPILSLREISKETHPDGPKLVEINAYCFNPNHYHLVLRQLVDGGISEYMKRLNGGYTCYFNEKNSRKGALLRGRYKSKHIKDNDYLLHTSAYVNLNNQVHQIRGSTPVRSSWEEYRTGEAGLCEKSIILEQFDSPKEYEKFALGSLELSLERKKEEKEYKALLME